MKDKNRFCFCLLVAVLTMASVLDGQTLGGPMHGKAVVCYVASWAVYRPGQGSFSLEDIEPSLCTHLVYSFAGLDESTGGIKSLDPWQDLETDYGKAGYQRIVALKERYPHLKVTIAIGGWNEGSLKYSKMAETAESRARFIRSVMLLLNKYKFDGLDLDWEYPARRDGRPIDKHNYVSLVKELKEAFEPQGYILTAALGAGKDTMEAAYELSKLSRHLSLIHMMCYDYHGTWDGVVGANAPLRGYDRDDFLSVEYTIKYMLSHGVSPYKLVLGLPMYGRTFRLLEPSAAVVFNSTPVAATGFPGPLTGEAGFMGYNEICLELSNTSSAWSRHWHEGSATPYLRDGARVVSYDNPRSIAAKVKMAVDYGLGGLMVWSMDTDDFRGNCAFDRDDAFQDFRERYRRMADDPVLQIALETLKLPDFNRLGSSHYTTSNGKLHLRLPDPPAFSNYELMRTINDATKLALEEKRIADEIERVQKMNEIPDEKPTKSSSGLSSSVALIVLGLICTYIGIKMDS